MVRLSDLVNPISKDIVFKFNAGCKVCYNDELYFVCLRRESNGQPAYQIRDVDSVKVHDLVLETELTSVCDTTIFDDLWEQFVYNGNNNEASNWIFNNILTKASLKDVKFGPTQDGKYYFEYFCETDNCKKHLEKSKN